MAEGGAVLPLAQGDAGAAVADVQRRLLDLGIDTSADPDGVFGPATRSGIEAFQHRRGLRVDGVCGRQTWDTLVEAGFGLGSRFLYRRTPMLRGDDVAELQQRLCGLGFDTGRVDGIFGDLTAAALGEFQRNTGEPVDGIVGPGTMRALRGLSTRHAEAHLVSMVRARDELRRAPNTLSGRQVALGEAGGLGATVAALRRALVAGGARVLELHHPDDATQAQQSNAAGVDAFVGLRLDPERPGCRTSYYSGYRHESPGGRRLAELVQQWVPPALQVADDGSHGMSIPLLRETRMPAVVVEIGPASAVVERGSALAGALAGALGAWAVTSWD